MSAFFKKNKERIILFAMFVFLLTLCSLFPYTGDDWAWGSSIGIERLESGFKNYNGRYVGNLVVLVLTRSNVLRVIVMASTIFGIIYMTYKLTNKNNFSLVLLATLLFLALPRLIFRQAIVWTSGFTNYAIPTVLILIYFGIAKEDIIDKKKKIFVNAFLVVLGFCTALFVEHITIYIIVITLLIIGYQLLRTKKVSSKYLFYLLGAIIGTVLMFSNGAYRNIADNQDTYRAMATSGIASVIEKVSQNYKTIYQELILNNTVLNIILGMLLLLLICQYLKKNHNNSVKKKFILNCSVFSIIGYLTYMVIKLLNPNWNIVLKYTQYFELAISVIFFLTILIVSFICFEDKERKQKMIFYWLSIGVLTLPLFVVQPIGSRCFFTSYCIFMLMILELYNNCINIRETVLDKIIIFAIVIYSIFLMSIYGYIFKINQERIQYLVDESNKGNKIVKVVNLPYEDYLWTSRPQEGSIWEERMKLFHHVPVDVKIKNITLQEWNKIK